MACSCRTGPWRAFIRGVAQVHRVEAPAPALIHVPHRLARSRDCQRPSATAYRQLRGFHASRHVAEPVSGNTPQAGDASPESKPSSTTTLPKSTDAATKKPTGAARGRPRKQNTETDGKSGASAGTKIVKRPSGKLSYKSDKESTRQPDQGITTPPVPAAESWKKQKAALKAKFPDGWRPLKKLSPDALAGIRALNAQFPDVYTTKALANKFEMSVEAIRRILKSSWQPTAEEEEERQERWFRRGKSVWGRKAELGVKPPRKWRAEGISRDPSYHEWSKRASERERMLDEAEVKKYREVLRRRLQGAVGSGSEK